MKISKDNSEHYNWGANCSGWHFVSSKNLSVIEELMPPNTSEVKHYHNHAEQFFYIINGAATFEVENEIFEINKGEGIHITPEKKHRIKNNTLEDLEFIVISQPTTRGDRINEPFIEKK